MTALANQTEKQVTRPLAVLVPLIKDDLQQGKEASEKAGIPYYRAAGDKMIEAKPQLDHGEFVSWIKRNFGISKQQAQRYMSLASTTNDAQKSRARDFSSIRDFERQTTGSTSTGKTNWHEPVKQIINKAEDQMERLREYELNRAEESRAQKTLAMQLIDIGYKALATKLHPDKGGSREAMARLNTVRDRLRKLYA